MKYPVAVWNTDGAYTGEIPNLPGVVTEADSIEELEASIKEAAAVWMEAELDCGRAIPAPTSIESYPEAMASENKGCLWMLVDINMIFLTRRKGSMSAFLQECSVALISWPKNPANPDPGIFPGW